MDFSLLKSRNFLLFIFGSAITVIGDEFLSVALALYMLDLTGSAGKFASVLAASIVPSVLISPFAGLLVDKVNRKIILIVFDCLRGLLLLYVFLYSLYTAPGEIIIYSVAFIFGICQSFYSPASLTIIPSLISEDKLVQGNLISSIITQISKIIAPLLAALLFSVLGLGGICAIDAVTFFAIALIIALLKLRKVYSVNNRIMEGLADGFRYFKNKDVLFISINGMLSHLFILPVFTVGFPYLVKSVFNGNDVNYGSIQTICSLGAVLTIFTVPLITKRFKDLSALNVSMYSMLGAISCLFAININWVFNLLKTENLIMVVFLSTVGFLFTLTLSTYLVFFSSFIQKRVENNYLGRFYSIFNMLIGAGGVLGSKIYGALFDMRNFLYPVLLACFGMILKIVLNYMTPDGSSIDENSKYVNSKILKEQSYENNN